MTKNLKAALNKTGVHDHIDPDYARVMGHAGAAGETGTLLQINQASEEQLNA